MGPNYALFEDSPMCRKPIRRRSTTSSNFSAHSEPAELFDDNFRPLQLYSPVSDSSRAPSVSSPFDERENWNLSPGSRADVDVPADSRIRADTQIAFPHPGSVIDFTCNGSQSLPRPVPRANCSTFLETGPSRVPYFRNGRPSARNIPAYKSAHGLSGHMLPFSDDLDILPIASYERTLSESLRNWK